MKNQTTSDLMVSISCITYNHEEYIAQTLDSFLMQKTDFKFEILIHDDASTDRTAEIVRDYARRHPDIVKPLIQTENQYSKGISNISGTFNFPRAQGKYICMCEGDDYWISPDKLQKQVDYMEHHPDCTLCFHSAQVLSVSRSLGERRVRPYKGNRVLSAEEVIDKSGHYPTASLFFPAVFGKNLPRYYFDCPVGDIPIQIIMASKGYAYYMDDAMAVYREGVGVSWTAQMKTGNHVEKQRNYYRQMKRMYLAFDESTLGRYGGVVKSAIGRIYFLTMINTKQYAQVKADRYKKYYRELSFRTRFFTDMEIRFPRLYLWLQGSVHKLMRK